jgi:hypothetical protein
LGPQWPKFRKLPLACHAACQSAIITTFRKKRSGRALDSNRKRGLPLSHLGKPVLKLRPDMSLEQAMAEVRKYLHPPPPSERSGSPVPGAGALGQARQFALLGSAITRLSQLSAEYGTIEPHSKAGIFGIYLKRIIRKAIGWYSRPLHEFDRTVVEALEQTRLDLQGLQQQIQVLDAHRRRQSEQTEILRSTIELVFANIATVQSLRQAILEIQPDLQPKFDELLNACESELAEVKTELLEQLPTLQPRDAAAATEAQNRRSIQQ